MVPREGPVLARGRREDDPVLCGLPENHEGAHEWEMRSDLVFTRTANGIGGLDRDRLRAVPREERPRLRIRRWEMVMAVRWPDWDHWLMIWPPEYPATTAARRHRSESGT